MDQAEAEDLLRKIDRRVDRIEQFLPTLPTREEMYATIDRATAPLARRDQLAAAIAPLATREELATAIAPLATREELAAAIAPLATREELAAAIAPVATREELAAAIAPLATREEMQATVDRATAPLATREEMHAAIKEESRETRRHFDVVAEGLRDEIRVIAENQVAAMARMNKRDEELNLILANHEGRITKLEVPKRGRTGGKKKS